MWNQPLSKEKITSYSHQHHWPAFFWGCFLFFSSLSNCTMKSLQPKLFGILDAIAVKLNISYFQRGKSDHLSHPCVTSQLWKQISASQAPSCDSCAAPEPDRLWNLCVRDGEWMRIRRKASVCALLPTLLHPFKSTPTTVSRETTPARSHLHHQDIYLWQMSQVWQVVGVPLGPGRRTLCVCVRECVCLKERERSCRSQLALHISQVCSVSISCWPSALIASEPGKTFPRRAASQRSVSSLHPRSGNEAMKPRYFSPALLSLLSALCENAAGHGEWTLLAAPAGVHGCSASCAAFSCWYVSLPRSGQVRSKKPCFHILLSLYSMSRVFSALNTVT